MRASEIHKDKTKTLHSASGNGHVQLVYILIQAGGEVNKLPQMVNFCNFSSLFYTFEGQEDTFLKFSYIKGLTANTSGGRNVIPGRIISSWGPKSGLKICPKKRGRKICPFLRTDFLRTKF